MGKQGKPLFAVQGRAVSGFNEWSSVQRSSIHQHWMESLDVCQ